MIMLLVPLDERGRLNELFELLLLFWHRAVVFLLELIGSGLDECTVWWVGGYLGKKPLH